MMVEIDRDAIPGTIEQATTNVYDDRGRLTSVATDEAIIHYEYAIATGQLIRTYTTDGGGFAGVRPCVRCSPVAD